MAGVDLSEFAHLMAARDEADNAVYKEASRHIDADEYEQRMCDMTAARAEAESKSSVVHGDNTESQQHQPLPDDYDVDKVPMRKDKFDFQLSMNDGFYLTFLYHNLYGVFTSNFEVDDEVMECMVIPLKPNGIKKFDNALFNVFKVLPIAQKSERFTHTVKIFAPEVTDPKYVEWHENAKLGRMRPTRFGKLKNERNLSEKERRRLKKKREKKRQDKYWLRWKEVN